MTELPRIDCAAAWAKLSPDVQASIGSAAIGVVAAWIGIDAALDDAMPVDVCRAFEDAGTELADRLQLAVEAAVPALAATEGLPLLPADVEVAP